MNSNSSVPMRANVREFLIKVLAGEVDQEKAFEMICDEVFPNENLALQAKLRRVQADYDEETNIGYDSTELGNDGQQDFIEFSYLYHDLKEFDLCKEEVTRVCNTLANRYQITIKAYHSCYEWSEPQKENAEVATR